MLEIAFFRRVARRIQLAVQIEAEAAVSVARKRDMRPRFGRDGSRRDNDVVDAAADPDAEPAVVKIGVERAWTAQD